MIQIDVSEYSIYLVCNHDIEMTSLIVRSLKRKCANNIFLLVHTSNYNSVSNLLKLVR